MNYDDRIIQGYSSISCTDKLLFLGHFGPDGKISVYRFGDGVKYIGSLTPIIGTVIKSIVTKDNRRLVCITSCGFIYVWDISAEVINRLESLTNNPLYNDDYIPMDSRIKPIFSIEDCNLNTSIDFDLIFDDQLIISLERSPSLNLNFFDIESGKEILKCRDLLKNSKGNKYMNCIKVDTLLSDGQWISCSTIDGMLTLLYISKKLLDEARAGKQLNSFKFSTFFPLCSSSLQPFTHQLDGVVNVNTIAWRPRNAANSNLTILCGCSDGIVRCLVFQMNGDGKLELYKQASYFYCKGCFSGSVYRMKSIKDTSNNIPYIIASCNMINELGSTNNNSSCNIFECVYQKLLQDSSDQIVSLGNISGFITDFCITPDYSSIIISSCNEHIYISRRTDDTNWGKPIKLI